MPKEHISVSEPRMHTIVVVPALNEEGTIAESIQSIQAAALAVRDRTTVDIVVVVDSSTDNTSTIARRLLRKGGLVLEVDVECAGEARRLGVDAALRRTDATLDQIWIANTDADSTVPRDWLEVQLELADSGVQVVAGIVRLDPQAETPEYNTVFDRYYTLHDDGTHPHVHAANIGFSAAAYASVGGWRAIRTGEDHDLWNRLGAAGARRVSTVNLVIDTSTRRVGRAPAGFAADLAALDETAA